MPHRQEERDYSKIFLMALKDPDINEKFRCIAKTAIACRILQNSTKKKARYEALIFFKDVIQCKKARHEDRKVSRKNYKRLYKEFQKTEV